MSAAAVFASLVPFAFVAGVVVEFKFLVIDRMKDLVAKARAVATGDYARAVQAAKDAETAAFAKVTSIFRSKPVPAPVVVAAVAAPAPVAEVPAPAAAPAPEVKPDGFVLSE